MTEELEPLPPNCDLCQWQFKSGSSYRRIQFVIDAADSVIGQKPVDVENSFHLVVCSTCAQKAEDLLVPEESEAAAKTLQVAQLLTAVVLPSGTGMESFDAVSADDFDAEDLQAEAEREEEILKLPEQLETAPTAREPLEAECSRCHRKQTQVGASKVLVSWRCSVCRSLVCPDCTLTVPQRWPLLYFDQTLCSEECWRKAGCPSE